MVANKMSTEKHIPVEVKRFTGVKGQCQQAISSIEPGAYPIFINKTKRNNSKISYIMSKPISDGDRVPNSRMHRLQ